MAGAWRVLLPEAGTNYVINPIGGAYTSDGFTDVGGGTPTVVSTYSYLGRVCYRLVTNADNAGVIYTLSTLTNAIHYMTLRIHTASDKATFDCSLDNATYTEPTLLSTEGDWYVYGYQFPAAQANGSTTLYIRQKGAGQLDMYIGHLQVELNTYATTPITGDRKGFTANGYYWNGQAHLSSSTRTAQERSGGLEVDLLDTYNFVVQFGVGKGMPPVTHHTQGMALLPGALYSGHKVEPRILDLVSTTVQSTIPTIAQARKNFINAIKLDRVSPDQPVVFRYYGNTAKPVEFHGYYDSGMESQQSSGRGEQAVARFICYDPFCYELPEGSTVLTTVQSLANADYVIRKKDGTWYNVNTAFNNNVLEFVRGVDNTVYIGGAFTDVGSASGDGIINFNPSTNTLTALGTGCNAAVYALAIAPNGDIYLGGLFTLAGGVANTAYIAYWDISAGVFLPLSTGTGAYVNALEFGTNGILYVGGNFTNLVDANGDYITKWDGSNFSSLGTGMNGMVHGLACAPNGDIYATGAFALAGGVANTAYIAKWNGTAWSALGTGLSGGTPAGYALAIDKAGNVYVGGNFTAADGVSCLNIAKWNGKTFEPLGSGLDGTVNSLCFDDDGMLYAAGAFTSAGGLTVSTKHVMWNGSTWAHMDAVLPGSPIAKEVYYAGKELYIGYDTSGTASTSYLNTVTNTGSASAYPIIKIRWDSNGTNARVDWIRNNTTGDTLWLNYSLQIGETLTIDLTPGNRSIKSDYRGNVWSGILRGSDLSSFRLLPGVNSIEVFVYQTSAPSLTAYMIWPITHWGSDMAAA